MTNATLINTTAQEPDYDTAVSLPDDSVSNIETDALTMVKQQNNIITLGELLEQKKHETRT